ncbi:MAG: hypothetical protein PVH00_05650 [Gemmatimonadota bacterium]|jgi:hypothetical protein
MSGGAGSIALLTLGTFHGVNPAMGWLFAVALGLQEQDRRAVWRALLPLGAGHALAVIAAVAVAAALGLIIPLRVLRWIVGGVLLAFGVWRVFRHRHPRYGGMRVGAHDLVIWSFLMASAHGAGLMVVPLVLDDATAAPAMAHMHHASMNAPAQGSGPATTGAETPMQAALMTVPSGLAATLLHTLGYLFATGLIAFVVFEKTGIGILRRAWVNLDLIWAATLIATGLLSLVL